MTIGGDAMKQTFVNEDGRTITRMDLADLGPLSPRQREMVREAAQRPVEYDEDCPPLSPAMREAAERMIAATASTSTCIRNPMQL